MARYFDFVRDVSLLPPAVQNDSAAPQACLMAEDEVLLRFTVNVQADQSPFIKYGNDNWVIPVEAVRLDDYRYVFLRNYTPDADACTDDGLKFALRRAIADVAAHQLRAWKLNPLVTNESGEKFSRSVDLLAARDPLPAHALRWLRPWSCFPPAVVI